MATEQQVKIAARIYEARDTAKRLLGDKYAAKIAEWQDAIRFYMKSTGLDGIHSVMELVSAAQRDGDAMPQMLLLAAYVEMIEPSIEREKGATS